MAVRGVIWEDITCPINRENVLGGVAYENKLCAMCVYVPEILKFP